MGRVRNWLEGTLSERIPKLEPKKRGRSAKKPGLKRHRWRLRKYPQPKKKDCYLGFIVSGYFYSVFRYFAKLIFNVSAAIYDTRNVDSIDLWIYGIENYIREIMMGKNFYNNLVVIDMGSSDDTMCILKNMEKDMNMKVLDKKSGKEYLKKEI